VFSYKRVNAGWLKVLHGVVLKKKLFIQEKIEEENAKKKGIKKSLFFLSYPVVMPHFTGFPEPTKRASSLLHMEGVSTAASACDMSGFVTSSARCSFRHSSYPLF
jgi:hypothetical protein